MPGSERHKRALPAMALVVAAACGGSGASSSDTSGASGGSGSTSASSTSASSTGASSTGAPTDPVVSRLTFTATPGPGTIRQNLTQWNFSRMVAVADDGVVHVVWTELGSNEVEYPSEGADPIEVAALRPGTIFHLRSLDAGVSWEDPVALTELAPGTDSASVAVSGERVIAIFRQLDDTDLALFARVSPDRGATWGAAVSLSDAPAGVSCTPASIAATAAGTVAVVWADGRSRTVGPGTATTKEIRSVTSGNGGASWGAPADVSSADGRSSWTPGVALAGDTMHVAWTDERDDIGECTTDATPCREEEYYRRSPDGGVTWDPEVRLTADPAGAPAESWAPSIAAAGAHVHVAFMDRRSGVFEVYAARSVDDGVTWEPASLVAPAVGAQQAVRPALAAHGDTVDLAWFRFEDFPADVHVQRSLDGAATWGAPVALTTNAASSAAARLPHVALAPDGQGHVIWYDTRHSDGMGPRIELYHARLPAGFGG